MASPDTKTTEQSNAHTTVARVIRIALPARKRSPAAKHLRREIRTILRPPRSGNGQWILDRVHSRRSKALAVWTGDSMSTEEVISAIRSRGSPDILVVHVGGVGSTGPFGPISKRAVDVVDWRPRFAPVHPAH